MRASQGTLSLNGNDNTLTIAAFGGSWVCDHRTWLPTDGLLLLPVTADSTIVVDLLVDAPVDLEGIRGRQLLGVITGMVAAANLAGARVLQQTLHECFRAERSVIYVVATRPPTLAPPGGAQGTAGAYDATVQT